MNFDDGMIIVEPAVGGVVSQTEETFFATANGLLGERGDAHEWQRRSRTAATYMNGFYDTEPIQYGESAFGYAREHQKMLNLPTGKYYRLFVDGQELDFGMAAQRCEYNLREGIMRRLVEVVSPTGIGLRVAIETITSMTQPEVLSYHFTIQADRVCEVVWRSALQEQSSQQSGDADDPRVHGLASAGLQAGRKRVVGQTIAHQFRTTNSGLELEVVEVVQADACKVIGQEFVVRQQVTPIVPMVVWKRVRYRRLTAAGAHQDFSYEQFRAQQIDFFCDYWNRFGIEVGAQSGEYQTAVLYAQYSLITNAGSDGRTNVCAKGLTGEGYGGHYFWDTEIYILPYFIYTTPHIARKLLEYRYLILPQARLRASELSYHGALYAWRTINGHEASAYYPAGTAQIHINADIAHGILMYYDATLDDAFMDECGYEMLYETAAFYADFATFDEHKGYCLNGVTGPDEYTALIDNNGYTNLMVQEQFRFIAANKAKFAMQYFVDSATLDTICKMAEAIYINRGDNELIRQDDTFFDKTVWDFERRPKQPLLLNYHPITIYNHRVMKQADVLLAMYLLRDQFSDAAFRTNYLVYEPLCTHDSSLSECIHGIIACRLGITEPAEYFFERSLFTDLKDIHGNTKDGIHMANMGGCIQFLWFGLAGLHFKDGEIKYRPFLPDTVNTLRFKCCYRNKNYQITIGRETMTVKELTE